MKRLIRELIQELLHQPEVLHGKIKSSEFKTM